MCSRDLHSLAIVATYCVLLIGGCGRGTAEKSGRPHKPAAKEGASALKDASSTDRTNPSTPSVTGGLAAAAAEGAADGSAEPNESQPISRPTQDDQASRGPKRSIDDKRALASGIRKIAGKRLTLYTDLPESRAVEDLPLAFDQAFAGWCEYFGLEPADFGDWSMRGFVIKERARFESAGLIPPDLPMFRNGHTRGHEFWMNYQTSDYYQQHLLLHEGTHGFMLTVLGGMGRPWYAEGMAELLATHRWHDGKLTMNRFPNTPDEVLRLGRIEIVQSDFDAGKARRLTGVFGYGDGAHQQNEAYGWCWAATAFLDGHPRYRDRFRKLHTFVRSRDFNQHVLETFRSDWDAVNEEWQVFVANIVHGYDFDRTAIDFTSGKQISGEVRLKVAADRGWQNTGIALSADTLYKIRTRGKFQVDDEPRPWISEAGGVSIRYIQGRPLGMLLGVVRPEGFRADSPSAFLQPTAIGLEADLRPERTGTLYLKINDSAGELTDNAGSLEVEVLEQ